MICSHFGKPGTVYPTPENTYILGLCTGSFATAAISASQNIAELIPAGVEAVIHAFRTGLHSFKLKRDLERSLFPTPKSWFAVVGLPEQRAADLIENYVVEKVRDAFSLCLESVLILSGYPKETSSVHQYCQPDQCYHQWATKQPRGSVELYDAEGSLLAY